MRLKFLLASAMSVSVYGAALAEPNLDTLKSKYHRPTLIPFPAGAAYTPQRAILGKMLFFDPRLSGAQNLSCASCHNPSFGFEVPVAGAIGSANTPLPRKANTVLNAAWSEKLFWDGRADSLEHQALGPILTPAEMNGNFSTIEKRLSNVPQYRTWFKQAFPADGLTTQTLLTAIATYERTVVAGTAPFDRWIEGDETALSPQATRGFVLFNGKANCSACHTGWNFTDQKFHDIGLPTTDIGRGKLEPNNPEAQYAFKTPGLRNLAYRAPFGHYGQFADLAGIIAFYDGGGIDRPSKSKLMKPLNLTEDERGDILAFLASLTAEQTDTALPNLPN